MASKLDAMLELERRGELDPQFQGALDELRARGELPGGETAEPQVDPRIAQAEADPFSPAAMEREAGRVPGAAPQGRFIEEFRADKKERALMLGTQDVGLGLAEVVGAPVDITTALMNLAPAGVEAGANLFLGDEDEISLPRITDPVGGSQRIARGFGDAAKRFGLPLVDRSTLSPQEELLSNINRLTTGAVATAGVAAPFAGSSGIARALSPSTLGGTAVDTAAGAGAGAGLTAGEAIAPNNPIAALFAALGGGLAGAKATQAGIAPKAAARNIQQRVTKADLPLDPVTGKRVSNLTADKAATIIQDIAGRDPRVPRTEATANIRQADVEAAQMAELPPTSGIASENIGLTAMERGARVDDPVPFTVRDQTLRDAALERTTSARDLDANPDLARQKVETDVAAERAAAQEPVTQSRKELEDLQIENARLASELETERAAKTASREQAVAETRVAKEEAITSEKDLGGEVAGKGGGEVAASEEIAGLVGEAKALAEAKKAGLYDEASRLGKNTEIDPVPLAEDARAIRDEIGPLAGQDASLNNILRDLDNLAPRAPDVDPNAKPGTPPPEAPEPTAVTVADLIDMRPRLSAAREAARKLKRGDVVKRLDAVNANIKATLDDMAAAGDEGALAFQKADKNFKDEFLPRFRQGVGRDLDLAERAGRPVEPSAQGGKFLKPGPGGKEAAQDFTRILKDKGDAAARRFVVADMAKVVGADGKINPNRLRAWIKTREGLFQAKPGLRAEADKVLKDVINRRGATTKLQQELERSVAAGRGEKALATKKVAEAKTGARLSEKQQKAQVAQREREAVEVERAIQKDAASLLLDTDPAVAVKRAFSSNDPRGAMRQITGKLRKDAEALAGWKRAVVDHLVDKVTTTNTSLASGSIDGPVAVGQLKKFFKQHERALAQVFSPEEMNNLRRAQKILEPLGRLRQQATVGSVTAENQRLFSALEAGLLGVTGNAITAGMVMKRIRVVMSLFPQKFHTARVVKRFFLEPELAALVLERNVKTIKSPRWNRRLTLLLGAEQAAIKADKPDEDEKTQ